AVLVLDKVQVLDEEVALPRALPEQRAHLVERLGVDLPTLRRRRGLAAPGTRVNVATIGARGAVHECSAQPLSAFAMVEPSAAGESATWKPALRIASNFAAAVPLPPEMMAPACPMRRPGGAVAPAMKPTTGFLVLARLTKSAASSSAVPPISPIMMMPL